MTKIEQNKLDDCYAARVDRGYLFPPDLSERERRFLESLIPKRDENKAFIYYLEHIYEPVVKLHEDERPAA